METLYDVQQILKRFGIYIYLGKRLYDIELMEIEIKNLHKAHLIDDDEYKTARLILRREHRIELSRKDETRFV
ncbi:Uncharacterized protein YqgQ [Pilibacter termitis]|uniref:Uncharacterized protein YqgQ n=1 Tax=Pilibacter termitis TaxID=263852 RepID=A0A1T4PTA7_9ENTE|nr:YqgQ family protein [Pilibacter termitis]SJZ94770.1 Uncharacterized protein YqgQ [Pilibacter termitis]